MTDEEASFVGIGWNFASHQIVKHTADKYARGDVHTKTVEGFLSIIKRGMYGVYQHVIEAYLHRYLVEFDFRYSSARASRPLAGARGALPMKELIERRAKNERYVRYRKAPLAFLGRSATIASTISSRLAWRSRLATNA